MTPEAPRQVDVPPPPEPLSLSLLADFNIPSGTEYEGLQFGGISALAYAGEKHRWLALSDLRYLYRLDINLDSRPLEVFPNLLVRLGERTYFDPEGMVLSPHGTLLVSTEGNQKKDPVVVPELFEVNFDGERLRGYPIPEKFLSGARHNHGFEALAITQSGDRVYLGTEYPLVQDGEPSSFRRAGISRILEIFLEPRGRQPREYAYVIEPLELPEGFERPAVQRGLTELVALAPGYLLALERSFIEEGEKQTRRVEIFSVSLDGATDVSDIESLEEDSNWIPATKTLLLDLETIIPRLTSPYQELENFEGMAVGPELPDGGRSLLVVSDDNFSERQRTAFLLFRLNGGP